MTDRECFVQDSQSFTWPFIIEDLKHDTNRVFDILSEAVKVTEESHGKKLDQSSISNLEKEMMIEKEFANMLSNVTFKTLGRKAPRDEHKRIGSLESFFTSIFEQIKALLFDVLKKLKERTQLSKATHDENKSLLINLQREQSEAMYQKQRYDYLLAEKNTILATCKKQQEQLEERSKRILQLQRDGTVALWKKEKQKIMDNVGSREAKLEEAIKSRENDNMEIKERLQKKIKELNNQIKLMKVEKECARGGRSFVDDYDLEERTVQIKRQLYLKERALIIAESEIQKQQKYFAGFIQGILKDFRILMSRMNIDEFKYDRHQQKFHSILENMLAAGLDGTFSSFRSNLPSQYLGINLHIRQMPLKRPSGILQYPLPRSQEQDVDIKDLSLSPSLVKWREGKQCGQPDPNELLREATMATSGDRYINRSKGTLNVEETKKQFPDLSEEYLLLLFEEFKKFDINNDWHLDASELLRAAPEALGKMATTDEVKEAMKEVDTENSDALDFINFVNVAQLIAKGEGKASLFKKKSLKALQRKDAATSSVCVIQ